MSKDYSFEVIFERSKVNGMIDRLESMATHNKSTPKSNQPAWRSSKIFEDSLCKNNEKHFTSIGFGDRKIGTHQTINNHNITITLPSTPKLKKDLENLGISYSEDNSNWECKGIWASIYAGKKWGFYLLQLIPIQLANYFKKAKIFMR